MTSSKSETAANAAENVRAKANEAVRMTKDETSRRAEGIKSSLAEELSGVASALKVASREFSDGSTEASVFKQAADGLTGASDAIRRKSLGEVVSDLNSFARRNPTAFISGAALLGFAASRFAKASAEHSDGQAETRSTAAAAPAYSGSSPTGSPVGARPASEVKP